MKQVFTTGTVILRDTVPHQPPRVCSPVSPIRLRRRLSLTLKTHNAIYSQHVNDQAEASIMAAAAAEKLTLHNKSSRAFKKAPMISKLLDRTT